MLYGDTSKQQGGSVAASIVERKVETVVKSGFMEIDPVGPVFNMKKYQLSSCTEMIPHERKPLNQRIAC